MSKEKCREPGCENKPIGTHSFDGPIEYCCHQHPNCHSELMGCEVKGELNKSALVKACEGLLDFIRKQYPDDFKPGGKGFTCPYHVAIEKAIIDCKEQIIHSVKKTMSRDAGLDIILNLMQAEFWKSSAKMGAFNSTHEGYAVIKEELEELWDGVKKYGDQVACREAIQVGAMAMRFLYDFGDLKVKKDDK